MNTATRDPRANVARLLLTACWLLLGPVAQAKEVRWDQETIRSVLQVEIQRAEKLARSAPVVAGVEAHNALALPPTTIRQRDQAWVEGGPDAAARQQLLQTELNQSIQQLQQARSEVTEIFITDRQGAIVAAYPLTSDYWQGDEKKWSRVMVDGWSNYVGLMSFDDSTRLNSVQISVPVSRGEEVIGVLVMGFKLSHVLARQLQHIGD